MKEYEKPLISVEDLFAVSTIAADDSYLGEIDGVKDGDDELISIPVPPSWNEWL